MESHARIVVESMGRKYRLRELGLSEPCFAESCNRAMSAFRMPTEHYPRSARGLYFWSEFVGTLGMLLAEDGWTSENLDSHDLKINSGRTRGIVVTRGDVHTGDEEETPRTNARKGRVTQTAVRQNVVQYLLIPEAELPPIDLTRRERIVPVIDGLELWLLLYHRDGRTNKIYMELSLPDGLDAQNRVSSWRERIVFEPILMDQDEIDITPDVAFDEGGDIDIEVLRRDRSS